jgi:hypothetical protein
MSKRRAIVGSLLCTIGLMAAPAAYADPPTSSGKDGKDSKDSKDGGVPRNAVTVNFAEVLHSTSALSRLRMRCRATGDEGAEQKPLDRLHCAFSTVSIRQQPPEKMATLENYGEILRELRAQCRNESPRSEPARMACNACRGELSDTCLYEQAMKNMRGDCAKPRAEDTHVNAAVALLERGEAERGRGHAQVMQRFCAACKDQPNAACWSAFWASITPLARCTLAMDGYELELSRQGKTSTWTGNLGGPCNTQVTLALDERRKLWTYTELRLSPERCAQGEALAQSSRPAVYSSAAQYAFSDLPAMCERITLQ